MALQVRMARLADLDKMMELASFTEDGLTNFPHDRRALEAKIRWSETSCLAEIDAPRDEFYLFALEDMASGRIIGTASIYSRVGVRWPFYSYKLSHITHVSRGVDRHFSTQILSLVNDFDGASEVGGLFLHPEARSGGVGQLLARSRYLFIAAHRERFGDKIVVELRGWSDGGVSPFWEAVGRKFFDSDFTVDRYNATQGNQFITDLMPRFPIYTALLPEEAQAVIGVPHSGSVPAKAMLEAEGFVYDGYVDIFDAGPTLHAQTDRLRSIAEANPVSSGLELKLATRDRPFRAQGRLSEFTVV